MHYRFISLCFVLLYLSNWLIFVFSLDDSLYQSSNGYRPLSIVTMYNYRTLKNYKNRIFYSFQNNINNYKFVKLIFLKYFKDFVIVLNGFETVLR